MKIRRAFYFFPVQLLFLHIKRSHLVLLVWLIMFGIITQEVGVKYGLPYLFLYPEYLGNVNFMSYLILGFSCGGFIMAFNMYSYIMHGFKFRFIATVSRPYQKFSFNNSIIPVVFVVVYLYNSFCFQVQKELEPVSHALVNLLGFLLGILVFVTISNLYFFRTNKDLFKISGKREEDFEHELNEKIASIPPADSKRFSWKKMFEHDQGWTVETYVTYPWRVRLARDCSHYDMDLIKRVFFQNHLNASIFIFVVIVTFLLLGSFKEYPVFLIPAGASIFLLVTIIIMVISSLYTIFRGWTLTVLVIGVIALNFLSQKTELFAYKNFAYGLDYSNRLAPYSADSILALNTDTVTYLRDKRSTMEVLNKWRRDINNEYGIKKPPLIVFCSSGGGIRSSLWTLAVMQKLDSLSNGRFGKYCRLITGASGGVIGSAYYRELMMLKREGKISKTWDRVYADKMSKDILNPVAFCIATSDLFIRYQHFTEGPYTYTKDRGYIFEKTLNDNLDNVFSRRLFEYRMPEENAEIPMLVFSPTIINHGRKLIISPMNVSYFSYHDPKGPVSSDGEVEFSRFFAHQNAVNLKYSTALRMSATFPYVMPMVSLPTTPTTEVMDAGIRDNYGTSLAIKFLSEFRVWIQNNTSGVIIITTRDRPRQVKESRINSSVYAKMSRPASNVVDNIFYTQDFENDLILSNFISNSGLRVTSIDFCLPNDPKTKISLSWHLTQLEKLLVLGSLENELNKKSFETFMRNIP